MRLLHTKDLRLETPENVPPYAILSHRWFVRPREEVSFQDLQRRQVPSGLHSDVEHTFLPDVLHKAGFLKLKGACDLALQDGLNYIWIDTCCIDKTSSAELSEAINSMYNWYRDSAVCYVYLHDVGNSPDRNALISDFRKAEWFKRGWTLQELLAPSNVYFFARDWSRIGSKATWVPILHEITHIRKEILLGISSSCSPSIAERMSWAVGRETEKVEDRAYSLMGIFEIHMPIIYGEGEKAFKRLQLEIMKISDDQTIFAWHDSLNYPHPLRTRGVLASSPDFFLQDDSHHLLINADHSSFSHYIPPSSGRYGLFQNQSIPWEDGHTVQNDGIHITLPMKRSGDSWLAVLKCETVASGQKSPCGIYLCEISGSNKFLRSAPTRPYQLRSSDLEGLTLKKIRMVIDHPPPPTIPRGEFFTLRSANEVLDLCSYYICPDPGRHEGQGRGWEPVCSDTQIELGKPRCGCVCFQDGDEMAIVLLGIEDHRPWMHLLTDPDLLRFIDAPPRSPSIPIFISSQFTSEPLSDPVSPLLLSPTTTTGSSTHQNSQKYSRSSTYQNSWKRSRTARPVQLQESTNGCAVCAIIRRGGINIREIAATRADMLSMEVLGNAVRVAVRKGRAGTSGIQPGLVEYVLTISVES